MEFYMHSDNPIPTTSNSLYNNGITDLIPIAEMSDGDMNASMQEALHLSSLEARYKWVFFFSMFLLYIGADVLNLSFGNCL